MFLPASNDRPRLIFDSCEFIAWTISQYYIVFLLKADPSLIYITELAILLSKTQLTLDDLLSQKHTLHEDFELTAVKNFDCGNVTYLLTVGSRNICLRRSSFPADDDRSFALMLSLNIDNVLCAEINAIASMLAVTVDNSLSLIRLEGGMKLVPLGLHDSKIKKITFFDDFFLLSIDHSQSCKMWNAEQYCCLRTFCLPEVSAITTLPAVPQPHLLYGTSDGKIFSLPLYSTKCEPIFLTNAPRIILKTRPKCQISNNSNLDNRSPRIQLSTTTRRTWNISEPFSALSMSDISVSEILRVQVVNVDFPELHRVVVVTSVAIAILNENLSAFEAVFSLSDLNLWNQSCVISADVYGAKEGGVWILLQSQNRRFALVFWNFARSSTSEVLQEKNNCNRLSDFVNPTNDSLSFLARSALSESSKLGKALSHITAEKSKNHRSSQRVSQSKCGRNQPVTFGHKIKSSGYAPQGKKIIMFKPQTNCNSGRKTLKSPRKQGETKLARRYDTDGRIPSTPNFVGVLESMQSPIYGLSYSPVPKNISLSEKCLNSLVRCVGGSDACGTIEILTQCLVRLDPSALDEGKAASGDRLAVAQGGGLCSIYNTAMLPAKRASAGDYPKPCAVLAGHGAAVSDVAWSLDGRLLLTCSLDRTARLWQASTGPKPCGLKLIVSSPRGGRANGLGHPINPAGGVPRNASTAKLDFVDQVQFGQFYLQDAFFHVTCRNKIYFFSYNIDSNLDALQKCHVAARYKHITTFEIDSCTRLTAVSSTNAFYSHLIVAAGSDRSLYVVDINTGDFVRRIPAVHVSTVTGIAINQGSLCSWNFSSEDSEGSPTDSVETDGYNYTLYATVAPGDSARLWDLRVASGHVAELASSLRPGSAGGYQGAASGTVRDPSVPPVTLTFSPGGNHLCMGALSNCNPVYMTPLIFDIRKPVVPVPLRSVQRQNSANVSLVVAWHPLKSEVVTGSIDGRLATFI